MSEWFEDEEFWADLYPFLFTEERYGAAGQEAERILALADPPGRTVLDLACGPGRHAVILARKGYQVTGVDRSGFLLQKARSRAEAEGVEVEWVEEDMRRFVRPGAFALVLNLFTSFGFFEDAREDLQVLKNIHRSLVAGGTCLLEMVGKEWLAREFQATTCREADDGSLLLERHEIFDDWSRIRNEWILVRGEAAVTYRFHHRIYSGQELKDRLRQAGFSEIRLFGGLDGRDYDTDAERLVAVARKSPGGPPA